MAQILEAALLRQRGHLIGWVPVCLALGIGGYFALLMEPSLAVWSAVAGIAMLIAVVGWRMSEAFAPLAWAVCLILIGALLAGARAHAVVGPVLGWRYYGAVEGRVVGLDRSSTDAVRMTLDQVVLEDTPAARTPTRVRVSLHDKSGGGIRPEPGMRVMTTAHLAPPSGPVEPDGFDFRRHAWFLQIGAVGYSRVPVMALAEAEWGPDIAVFQTRMAISERVRAALPNDIGGFAAAVTTGDRSGISQSALANLMASNTAHLLAISGLHMGLLSGFVFGLVRLLCAAIPIVGLTWPVRRTAALAAIAAATAYLMLSGGNVATERAYIIVIVALGAILIGRRAISLRAVAIAATILLALRPEALVSPGFQMSFAATVGLVAVFGAMRNGRVSLYLFRCPSAVQWGVALVMSSAVAGLATAPVGAAHFNTVSQYGLVANLASVPLMGMVVIPAAVAAALLAPFGLEALGLEVMGLGLRWILFVAQTVAGWQGAQGHVVTPAVWVLPVMALGALFIILWQGAARMAGVAAIMLAFVGWSTTQRPLALISDTGSLVGLQTSEGRALSKVKGAGFVARNWLENDGDGSDQTSAAALWGEGAQSFIKTRKVLADGRTEGRPGASILHILGKRGAGQFSGCDPGDIAVFNIARTAPVPDCEVYDPKRLRETGSVAIYSQSGGQLIFRTARDATGLRLWSRWPD